MEVVIIIIIMATIFQVPAPCRAFHLPKDDRARFYDPNIADEEAEALRKSRWSQGHPPVRGGERRRIPVHKCAGNNPSKRIFAGGRLLCLCFREFGEIRGRTLTHGSNRQR